MTGRMKKNRRHKGGLIGLGLTIVLCAAFLLHNPPPARACVLCVCETLVHTMLRLQVEMEHNTTRDWITDEFEEHRSEYLIKYLFGKHIMPAVQELGKQIVMANTQQAVMIGGFMDAQHQLETQRLLQEDTASIHKRYQPAPELCSFGTLSRPLADNASRAEMTSFALAQASQTRQMQAAHTVSGEGYATDLDARKKAFLARYCAPSDIGDNPQGNAGLAPFCTSPPNTMNRDINFFSTFYEPLSLDIDMSDAAATDDELDIIALKTNLYAHNLFENIPPQFFQPHSVTGKNNNQDILLDIRAIVAKRSVAENSMNELIGMKTQSQPVTGKNYATTILEHLGMDTQKATTYLGARPSYYALMEVLTKKIYQDPKFYVSLYDTTANLERKGTALRAIGLMQNMDLYKSRLRSEAVMSVLLEDRVMAEQERVRNRLSNAETTGTINVKGGGP